MSEIITSQINAYKVGGAVRDTLLGLTPKDIDYVVVGATPEQMVSLGFRQVGADFPVFLHPDTKEEYALARIERKTGIGYSGFTAETNGVTLEEDLARRDLTINSMAIDEWGSVFDPYGGQDDLNARILRHTSEAFREDPLRVIRVARFAARYSNFAIAETTMTMMREMVASGELEAIPNERFHAELDKVYSEREAGRFFTVLESVGVMRSVTFFRDMFGTLERQIDQAYMYSILQHTQHLPAVQRKIVHIAMIGQIHMFRDDLLVSREIRKLWATFRTFNFKHPASELLDNFTTAGAFRQGDDFTNLLAILDVMDAMHGTQSGSLARILSVEMNTITSKNFPGVTGKAIGEAIREARVANIEQFFADLRGE